MTHAKPPPILSYTAPVSIQQAHDASCRRCGDAAIDTIIQPRSRDLGGFGVRRVLPAAERRLVGPFLFFDHMGPAKFAPGQGIDVRPHPHIHLATVTYLFEGEIVHRDSLGFEQPIRPGAINWMTAGRGIVHSERTSQKLRETGSQLHGIQLWVALPTDQEDTEPAFHHYPADELPSLPMEGVSGRLLVGSAFGQESPVAVHSPMFYAELKVLEGHEIPLPEEHPEKAAYVVSGTLQCGDEVIEAGSMVVFADGKAPPVQTQSDSHLMLLGGATLDGSRHMWWNFVSSSRERIEQAKADWKAGRFPKVPGDETEFIPLPED